MGTRCRTGGRNGRVKLLDFISEGGGEPWRVWEQQRDMAKAESWEDEPDPSTRLDQTGVRMDAEGRPLATGQAHM